jgi:hypothetical protein
MEAVCEPNCKMGIREYLETISAIIRSPAKFYESVASETGSRRALLFLMISGIFYCSVSMTYFFENSLKMGVIMMVNAIVMPALGAVFTFSLLGMTTQNRVPYGKVFNVFAYASGAVMVISWIPGLAMIMEPFRAVLVGIGLVKTFGIGKVRSVFLVIMTAVLLLLFFWTAAPLVAELRHVLY